MLNPKAAAATIGALMMMSMSASPIHSQSHTTSSVIVAVPENYPAFRPVANQPDPRARELKALIIRTAPVGGHTVILLNPSYVSPATLNDALAALRACGNAAAGAAPTNLIAIRANRAAQPLDSAKVSALQERIAELQRRPVSRLAGLYESGRNIIADVPVCRGT